MRRDNPDRIPNGEVLRPKATLIASGSHGVTDASSAGESNPRSLLESLRRTWPWLIGFGVPAGVIAALLVWRFVPTQYTAFAIFRMAAVEPRLVFETADRQADFTVYRQTQRALIGSLFVLNAALNRPGIRDLEVLREQDDPLNWIKDHVKVDFPDNSELLRIAITGRIPREVQLIVNAIKDAYLEEVVYVERDKRYKRIGELERIHKDKDNQIQRQRGAYQQLARNLGTTKSQVLTVKQEYALQHFAALKAKEQQIHFDLLDAGVALTIAKSNVEKCATLTFDKGRILEEAANHPDIANLDMRRRIAENRIAEITRVSSAEGNRHVARHQDDINKIAQEQQAAIEKVEPLIVEKLRDRVRQQARADVARCEQTIELYERQRMVVSEEAKGYEQETKRVSADSSDLEFLQKDISKTDEIVQKIHNELEALRIELDSPPRVRLMHAADLPTTSERGKRLKLTALAGLGMLGLVCASVVGADLSFQRIGSVAELEKTVSGRVLGSVPYYVRRLWATDGSSRMRMRRLHVREAIDSLRAAVVRHCQLEDRRVLMVTSAISAEGKTTVTCQLAESLARAGFKTLVVDADLRRPTVHEVFEVERGPGLAELLSGKATATQVIRPTCVPRLWTAPAGRQTDDSLFVRRHDRLVKLLGAWRKEFDVVLIDTPPVLSVSDTLSISSAVDGALLSVRRDYSRRLQLEQAVHRLERFGANILGVVAVGAGDPLYDNRYFTAAHAIQSDELAGVPATTAGMLTVEGSNV